MNKFIVRISALGHEGAVYEVDTNLPLHLFQEIDNRYGMQYRHQFTSINQLQEGARKEGYEFEYKELVPMTNYWKKVLEYEANYIANCGNY